ncbi:hypothetical protein MPNT_80091 [Candidatus Methylacidithermus pantelleriae]|uniref:Uncharacterized protein n=1 Tax=Candidatus Methylacidithermus pantelleriae TaxID=2744239 RepID=A0A8J2BM77_9BACT|nr:hypothetical protein MPNT_690001 [Candidatus Methylacidithermus pantelleriae]CAF0705062.1 hypothetical protein MPNT_80091 [Candidatus Methylacidithermus pantelleriae]
MRSLPSIPFDHCLVSCKDVNQVSLLTLSSRIYLPSVMSAYEVSNDWSILSKSLTCPPCRNDQRSSRVPVDGPDDAKDVCDRLCRFRSGKGKYRHGE